MKIVVEVSSSLHVSYLITQKCKQHLIVQQNFQGFICDVLNWGGEKIWDQSNHCEEFSKELMQLSHQKKERESHTEHISFWILSLFLFKICSGCKIRLK